MTNLQSVEQDGIVTGNICLMSNARYARNFAYCTRKGNMAGKFRFYLPNMLKNSSDCLLIQEILLEFRVQRNICLHDEVPVLHAAAVNVCMIWCRMWCEKSNGSDEYKAQEAHRYYVTNVNVKKQRIGHTGKFPWA